MNGLGYRKFGQLLLAGVIIFNILSFITPILAHLKVYELSDPLYRIFMVCCHQRPWRSYHIFDLQYGLDARCMFIYLGIAVAGLVAMWGRVKPLRTKDALILMILLGLPLVADGMTQLVAEIRSYSLGTLPFWESTNLIRSITGGLFGIGLGMVIFPSLLNNGMKGTFKDFGKPVLIAFTTIFLLIPFFSYIWFATSIEYRPSHRLLDHRTRIPGYNYEISGSAAHTTIDRHFYEAPFFIERALRYMKFDLVMEYEGDK